MRCWVYILASRRNGTLYTGVTSNLEARIYQHKNGVIAGFTKEYSVHRLVWFEEHDDIRNAITREKQIKGWNRAWKIRLIERLNPGWKDLSSTEASRTQTQSEVFIRRDPRTGDVILSRKPESWDGLFELYGKGDVDKDFMGPADRRQPPQDRDPFKGWPSKVRKQ